jgi:FAD/FMN-containing dehydrogenase
MGRTSHRARGAAEDFQEIRNRRAILRGLSAAALGCFLRRVEGSPDATAPSAVWPGQVNGAVVARGSPTYEVWRQSMVWQRRKAARYPQVIVQANAVSDVAAAVNYARQHGLRVVTRCGGHNMSACFLRDGGMLIDVSRLDGIEVDRGGREVVAGPGVLGRALNERLRREQLAFPTAGCGMVPIGGFLLGGGLGLNGNQWGPASAFSIIAVELVTADGQLRSASATENSDLFWAVRGGGPGLFCVVTSFRLRAYDLPTAITGNTLTFPFSELVTVTDAIAVYIDATVYAVSRREARRKAVPVLNHPIAQKAIVSALGRESTFEENYSDDELGFSQRRYAADNVFTSRLHEVATVFRRRLLDCPTKDVLALFAYKGSPKLPEAACSVTGDFYVPCYLQWDNHTEDSAMGDYLESLFRELVPLGVGSYVNEMNLEGRADGLKTCYSAKAWERLAVLRAEWDPDRVFDGFLGLT